jgi:pyruvate-formate lyase-activating enzyme
MFVKNIIDEVFQDYKKPSMMIATCKCDWKCLTELELDIGICQNSSLVKQKTVQKLNDEIVERYLNNPITKAIIIGGLEPFLQFEEVIVLIHKFRDYTNDDIVIYTGYYPEEIKNEINRLKQYKNIIVKYGRYNPNYNKAFDDVLGIELISSNQFAVKIS